MPDPAIFPVMAGCYLKGVPWDFVAPHDTQAQRNHGGQTLARLAQRGGLDPTELLCVLRDQRHPSMVIQDAESLVIALLAVWLGEHETRGSAS